MTGPRRRSGQPPAPAADDGTVRHLSNRRRGLGGRHPLGTGVEATGGLVIGVGVSSRAEGPAAVAALKEILTAARHRGAGTDAPVVAVATWDAKSAHPVVQEIAKAYDVPVWGRDAEALRAHDPGSARVAGLTGPGIGAVARAAVLACGAEPLTEKRVAAGCTFVVGWQGRPVATSGRDDDAPADPLRHHGDVEARAIASDYAVNVIVDHPPDWLREALDRALDRIATYPDERAVRVRVADELRLDPERLLLVNGAAEAFSLIAQARPWRAPLVVHPQFTEPDAALRAAGRPAAHHLLDAADGFTLHPEAVPTDADLVVIGNPTNPTSRLHTAADIRAIRDAGPPDRLVLVDEAFMDLVFVRQESVLAEAAGSLEVPSGRLCVVRSLTKSFGLAGLRAGYVVGDPDLIARLRDLQPPWSVNALALAAIDATAGAIGRQHLDLQQIFVDMARQNMVKSLTRCGLTVVPEPHGPFVLVHHPDAAALRERLREKGIAVRRGDTFPGLGPEWLRFAVRSSGGGRGIDYDQLKEMVRDLDIEAGRRRPRRRPAAARSTKEPR